MEKFEKLTAVAAPMPASNIDTDIIMPKAFLKRIDKEGVLEGLFHGAVQTAPQIFFRIVDRYDK